jgi:hypothetical protein
MGLDRFIVVGSKTGIFRVRLVVVVELLRFVYLIFVIDPDMKGAWFARARRNSLAVVLDSLACEVVGKFVRVLMRVICSNSAD